MLYLLFTTLGAACIMIFMRMSNGRITGRFTMLGVNYLVCALLRRERPGRQEVLYGVLVGVPNFVGARLLLKALEIYPAIIVYPVRGVGGIAVVSLAGVLLFGERLKKHQWYAMAAITEAIVLLNL